MQKSSDLYRLAWALCNIMDGMKSWDISAETGLPEDECKLIDEIRNDAMILMQDMNWELPTSSENEVI